MKKDVDFLIKQLDFNYSFAEELVKDVSEDMMCHSPSSGLENHPAFTLGHLAGAAALMIKYLGFTPSIPEQWEELFKRNGPGDPRLPEKDRARYPNKTKLLAQLKKQHEHLKEVLIEVDPEVLLQDKKWRFHQYFPDLLNCSIFMIINHESMHLGQLSAWRRAMNLPSALGRMS